MMKNILCHSFLSSMLFLLIAIASIYGYPTSRDVTEVQLPAGEQRGHDLVLRDDKEPFVAAFNYENNTLSIMSCGEYGFGGPGLRTDTNGCNRTLTFDFRWRQDFSYHPRKKSD